MPKGATIISGALFGLHNLLTQTGLEAAALGRQSGVPVAAWRDWQQEIPLVSFVEIYERGAAVLGQPNIGWKSGPLLDLRNLGELGDALLAASTVGSALRTFERFIKFVQSETDLQLSVEDGVATVTYRIVNPDIWPRRQDAEFTLSVLTQLIRRGAGDDWNPDLICFEHSPARSMASWAETAGAFCLFECETNSLSFPATVLHAPMPKDDTDRYRRALESLSRDLMLKARGASLMDRTRTAIFAGLGTGTSDQESIARRLGLSRRSLHRHLGEEGIRFSTLLDECRFRVARHALIDTPHSLAQIACELDYSDQSAFERAFKRRTGLTPKQYRQSFEKVKI
ncbi:AraC family transcriptional regulator [Roseibium aggregatum]|uniref:AraC family transcriptional regulator ligand-binding domain-containing protein n=1 Tax=Roseibium aggregatum TaxID=187304 RepID=A0A939J2D5_9HYPH|nr:AraC family transcriptional regulator [Roseibium aggregatum]MBN9671308.1 AraC family transcriptional regulator ligand-binding domain-containing protein [Roseibium aggregatum]